MRVIVCGAGQVGSTIARHLASERIDVTVIDSDPALARRMDESYDVRGVVGHASHPETLERAGADGADMLIAVTRSDEVNMVACEVAASLFGVKRRIARVRHEGYLKPALRLYGSERLAIDVVISPEIDVAHGIARRLSMPGAFDTASLAGGAAQLLGVHCDAPGSPVIGKAVRDLLEHGFTALALVRDGVAFVPNGDERVRVGDDIYLLTAPAHAPAVMKFLGHTEQLARRVVIVGGGHVGLNLARHLALTAPALALRVIEGSRERAEYISRELAGSAIVLHGDALDRDTLIEANIATADVVIAVTNDDETNVFSSALAKREGCLRCITLVNKSSYEPILQSLGLDVIVSPNAITISSLLRHVRPGAISRVYTLREEFGEIIEAPAMAGAPVVAASLRDLEPPAGLALGAVVRNGSLLLAAPDLRVQPGDRIIAVVAHDALHAAEAFLAGAAAGQGEAS